MKVVCTGNALADMLLTPVHRDFFDQHMGPSLAWSAPVGMESTVYAITIRRGYPFYFVRTARNDWNFIPAISFTVLDDQMSSHWRFWTGTVEVWNMGRRDMIFATRLYPQAWNDEPAFLEKLTDGKAREVEMMTQLAAIMDAEFDVPA